MSEISEFEARISAALERIGRAVAVAEERAEENAAAQDAEGGIATEEMEAELGRLRDALESEKDANAQLEERVKSIHERQESHVATLEAEVTQLRDQLAAHDKELLQLRRVNARLRDNNGALRDANAKSVGDVGLVNTALMTELEALKVVRAAEATELDAILTELKAAASAGQAEQADAEEV